MIRERVVCILQTVRAESCVVEFAMHFICLHVWWCVPTSKDHLKLRCTGCVHSSRCCTYEYLVGVEMHCFFVSPFATTYDIPGSR